MGSLHNLQGPPKDLDDPARATGTEEEVLNKFQCFVVFFLRKTLYKNRWNNLRF